MHIYVPVGLIMIHKDLVTRARVNTEHVDNLHAPYRIESNLPKPYLHILGDLMVCTHIGS